MKSPRPQLSHALYLDQTPTGSPRISVTQARRGRRGGGRRLLSLTGHHRDLAYPHLSTILWNCHGRRLRTVADDLPPGEYHPVSETAAIPMLLLMDAVKAEPDTAKAQRLAAAIADMHPCESAWWWACHRNRSRPRQVLQALALMYA